MNIQDKRDFFDGYRRALLREKRLSERVLEYRERASSASAIKYSDMPKGTNTRSLDDYMIELEEKIEDLTKQKNRTDQILEIIMRVLDGLDPVDHDYLYLKYIKMKRNPDIGLRYRISRQSVYNALNRAIDHADITDRDIQRMNELLYID